MTLTINPASTLRPLGEEHLRMFRRALREDISRSGVTIPECAKIHLSEAKVAWHGAQELATQNGGRLATITEVVSNRALLNKGYSESGWIFIDWRDAPVRSGWYKVDYRVPSLEFICKFKHREKKIDKELAELEWWQKLRVYNEVKKGVARKRPLAFCVNSYWGKLQLSSAASASWEPARIAYIKND